MADKVVSFFEDHTDIIVKKRRETYFGHKIFLTGGKSNLILDCLIAKGNPSDTDQYIPILERYKGVFRWVPRLVSTMVVLPRSAGYQ